MRIVTHGITVGDEMLKLIILVVVLGQSPTIYRVQCPLTWHEALKVIS